MVGSGDEAVELFEQGAAIDLVFSDVQMTGSSPALVWRTG
jgi:CheY-like chemotaxis protein